MIVGTAGHVDHGKTTLVRSLTGVDTDRLKEEKARGITIDLGFAYMPGPGAEPIGFVDVPGHERLVRTMVAGAAGIDFALVVIAGDDGIMPQTREHLEILALLGLTRGLIAVTKCDRIDDERRAALQQTITTTLAGTPFADFEVVFVSAATGDGIATLRERLVHAAADRVARRTDAAFRLPVDRAFNLAGIGTVVTGTALCGTIAVGDEVVVQPGARRARVRSLHAHNRTATAGRAGERCALALAGTGIGKEVVGRGSWICTASASAETTRFDADLHLLAGERRPLRDGSPMHLHVGASDVPARVVVLEGDELVPGGRTLVQIVMEHPLPLRHGDLFVIRDTSGQRTVGGGSVIDPRAPQRRRRSPERRARLEALRPTDPALALGGLLQLDPGFEDVSAFAGDRGLGEDDVKALHRRLSLTALRAADITFVHTEARWREWQEAITARLASYHAEHPELPGIAGEKLRLALPPVLSKPLFAVACDRLVAERQIAWQGHWVRLPNHVAELGPDDKRIASLVAPLIAKDRFRPPRVRDLGREIGLAETSVRRTCKALVRKGDLIEIAPDHFFLRPTVVEMAAVAASLTRSSTTGVFTAADFRDKLDNGRKVAIQILEYFDYQGLTRRQGDLRWVVKAPDLIFGARPEAA